MRNEARAIFNHAIAAVQPDLLIARHLHITGALLSVGRFRYPISDIRNIYVVAAGKAAAAMGQTAENQLGDFLAGGLVVTKYHHGLLLQKLMLLEAGHPVPDENGRLAAQKITALAEGAGEGDLIILLLSGGASALIADLSPDIPEEEFDQLTRDLLFSGAAISEINSVRKHLSTLKGGQLARLIAPARAVCLALSDVPGDAPDVIGSGPLVPDSSTYSDVHQILDKYQLFDRIGHHIRNRVLSGLQGRIPETPKPGETCFSLTDFEIIGNNRIALEAAAKKAASLGFHPVIAEKALTGEASDAAFDFCRFLQDYQGTLPVCILAGGETTVTVKGTGKGGRNQELALAALVYRMNNPKEFPDNSLLLSAASDGTDGPTDAAGAFVDDELVREIRGKNTDPIHWLSDNDSFHFFQQTNAHFITGPTQTNVMDLLIMMKRQ